MSRKRLVTRGVILGYGAIATQILYSFSSIPLVLSYLSTAEFGLWGLTQTIVGYLCVVEFGMTNGFQRHLFDFKDDVSDGRYGRLFVASLMAFTVIALLILVVGGSAVFWAGRIYQIPTELAETFRWTLLGQTALAAVSMITRMLGAPLYVHQRHDLIQFSQIITLIVFYLVLRLGLHWGWGLYSMLANTAAGVLWGVSFSVFQCLRLRLYPTRKALGWPRRSELASVFQYSRDMFVVQVGGQWVAGLPLLLLPRLLGLEAAALWTVCSRPFMVLRQLVWKPGEISISMLCELYTKGELLRMLARWSHVTQFVTCLSVCAFCVCAANNSAFLPLWLRKSVDWPAHLNWLFAMYCIAAMATGSVVSTLGFEKRMGFVRFAPLLEGLLLVLNALWMTRVWGIGGLIGAATIAHLGASFQMGLRHLAKIGGGRSRDLFMAGFGRILRLLPLAIACAWLASKVSERVPGYLGLLLSASAGLLSSLLICFYFGFSAEVRGEILRMLQQLKQRFFPSKIAAGPADGPGA